MVLMEEEEGVVMNTVSCAEHVRPDQQSIGPQAGREGEDHKAQQGYHQRKQDDHFLSLKDP